MGCGIGRQVSLSKDLATAAIKPTLCVTCKALTTLPPADREALQAAIDNDAISVRLVVEVCEKNGVTVSVNTIYAHRHKRCPRP